MAHIEDCCPTDAPVVCAPQAICTEFIGPDAYNCTCPDGYIGDPEVMCMGEFVVDYKPLSVTPSNHGYASSMFMIPLVLVPVDWFRLVAELQLFK